MKNRLILCLLLCGLMLYYAVPRLTIHFSGLDGIFAFSWFILAFLVIGGNLAGFLYSKKNRKKRQNKSSRSGQKVRSYGM